jgi:hypothetical protein
MLALEKREVPNTAQVENKGVPVRLEDKRGYSDPGG